MCKKVLIMNRKLTSSIKLLASMVLLQCMTLASADDTELFFAEKNTELKPNLLFVMDVSGSMDKEMDPSDPTSKTRLATMQSALRTVLKSAPKNLNVGLMEYGELQKDHYDYGQWWWKDRGQGQYPSGISFPISDIDALALPIVRDSITDASGNEIWWKSKIPEPTATRTVREYIADITDEYFKDSWYKRDYQGKSEAEIEMPRYGTTPIVDALYEAARYYRGDKIHFGMGVASESKAEWNQARSAVPSSYEGEPISWDDTLCDSNLDFTGNQEEWKIKNFKVENYNEGFNKRWGSDNICAVDINNPTATSATAAACQANEICKQWWTEKTPERLAQDAVRGTKVCEPRYNWYCPGGEKPDETGKMGCPVDRKRGSRKSPDRCWMEGAKRAVTYRAEIGPQERWNCRIPRCAGAFNHLPKYTSPIKNVCQSNFIVLMSDGKPEYSDRYDTKGFGTKTPGFIARGLANNDSRLILKDKTNPSVKFDKHSCKNNKTPSGYASGKCGPELTEFLSVSDQMDGDGFDGKQSITTFAIGFGLDKNEPKADEYLESLVTTGVNPDTKRKYGYFVAQDEVTLASAFGDIVKKIGETTDSLSASGYSVNVKNGVSHENTIYVPIFRRKETPTWAGNLKKFKITEVNGRRKIVDKNGKVAMTEFGVFQPDTQDFWSNSKDGAEVEAGGVASILKDADKRTLYTNSAKGKTLEPLKISNAHINYSTLGLEGADKTPEYRAKLIRFIRGEKYSTDKKAYVQRYHMGDMMHSDPAVVTYDKNFETSGKKGGQVLYIGTNEGYLHAFDTVTGEELFAFMPEILLKNIDRQYKNDSVDKHVYGVDGPITVWNKIDHNDASKNKHYIYFGLRRGGRAYYALDVTNPLRPKLMWKLKKGTTFGGNKVFAKMGQTWSKATVAKIRKDKSGEMRPVVVFSGGYDINNDLYADKTLNPFKKNSTTNRRERKPTDNIGTDIYIVDAIKGPKGYSWSMKAKAKNATALKHSVPGGVRLVDMDRDGGVDRMYFADMGGNVWRLELPVYDIDGNGRTELVKFADLGDGGSTKEEDRKFYTVPDVAMLKYKGKNFLSVAIGSGYRSHPLYEKGAKDNFFVLIDKAVHKDLELDASKPNAFTTIKFSNLEKMKATVASGAFTLNTGKLSKNKNIIDLMAKDKNIRGWALELPSKGEKVLATSITRNGSLVFTSLAPNTEGEGLGKGIPETQKAQECGAPRSQGRAYVLDLLTGQASQDVNEDGTKKENGIVGGVVNPTAPPGSGGTDIMSIVTDNTIPNTPQPVYIEPKCDTTTRKCTQTVDIRIDKKSSALLPESLDYLERRYWSDPIKEGGF